MAKSKNRKSAAFAAHFPSRQAAGAFALLFLALPFSAMAAAPLEIWPAVLDDPVERAVLHFVSVVLPAPSIRPPLLRCAIALAFRLLFFLRTGNRDGRPTPQPRPTRC